MKKKNVFSFLLLFTMMFGSMSAQTYNDKPVREVKNVILMITDGTSFPVLSTSRWYQRYLNPDNKNLNIDPYLSGSIITYCSNAPIGDSAPTTSCYVTGMPSIAGYIATYPKDHKEADLIPVDPKRAYRPMMTLQEATRLKDQRRVGLVVTCEFPHATPADLSAHTYNRKRYDWIVPQMVYNHLDVVIGGGASLLNEDYKQYLQSNGYSVFLNDKESAFNANGEDRVWQLYHDMDIPYERDRDPKTTPSLAEMTSSALKHLSQGKGAENGFFLMIEGSKVDWAAHANDPVALLHEFIAFDKAFKTALDFAKKDGNTAIIVTSDHGNSGFSLGKRSLKGYATVSIQDLFKAYDKMQKTSIALVEILNNRPFEEAQDIFEKYEGYRLTDYELDLLKNCKTYKNSPIPLEQRSKEQIGEGHYEGNLSTLINKFNTDRTPFEFTTNGHTGEEVFLAIYTPDNVGKLVGVNQNTDLHKYLASLLGFKNGELQKMSDEYYAPHTEVFEGFKYEINHKDKGQASLIVYGKKGKKLEFESYTSVGILHKGKKRIEKIQLPVPAVYVDKNDAFYLPKEIKQLLED